MGWVAGDGHSKGRRASRCRSPEVDALLPSEEALGVARARPELWGPAAGTSAWSPKSSLWDLNQNEVASVTSQSQGGSTPAPRWSLCVPKYVSGFIRITREREAVGQQ